MSIKVSGGGGGGGYPGVTADGLTPGGLAVSGAVQIGAPAHTAIDNSTFAGFFEFDDEVANVTDGWENIRITQAQAIPNGGFGAEALVVSRSGSIAAQDYGNPAITVDDSTASALPVLRIKKQGTVVLELTTRKSITGALASVTDANAKAVLTSIIATLTGLKVANDNTT